MKLGLDILSNIPFQESESILDQGYNEFYPRTKVLFYFRWVLSKRKNMIFNVSHDNTVEIFVLNVWTFNKEYSLINCTNIPY